MGIVNVPDPRLDKLGVIHNSEKVVPASIEFVDIAGIVKGASEGKTIYPQHKKIMKGRVRCVGKGCGWCHHPLSRISLPISSPLPF